MRENRENMGLYRGKRKDNGKWICGHLLEQNIPDYHSYIVASFIAEQDNRHTEIIEFAIYEVIPETVGQYTGLTDKNGVRIFEGDIVKIVDFQMGCVAYECGAFGIAVKPYIDWNYLDSEIAEITGCNNSPDFCLNDNLISLWELMWNYNQEENSCDVVQVIGNIHDSPELLEGDTE